MIEVRRSRIFEETGDSEVEWQVTSDSMLLGLVSSEQLFELGLSPADLTNTVCR